MFNVLKLKHILMRPVSISTQLISAHWHNGRSNHFKGLRGAESTDAKVNPPELCPTTLKGKLQNQINVTWYSLIEHIFNYQKVIYNYWCSLTNVFTLYLGAPPWSSGSVLDHRLLPPVFESRRGHIWRLFRLSLRLIAFGGRKTSIIIIFTLSQSSHLGMNASKPLWVVARSVQGVLIVSS